MSSVLPVKAAQPHEKIPFVILQQRADLSLIAFAEQADLTLIFPFDIVQEKTTNCLVGTYSIEEAVQALLSGTGLSAKVEGDGQLSISTDSARGGVNFMTLDFCTPQRKVIAQAIRQAQAINHTAPLWCSAALACLAISATSATAQSDDEVNSKGIEEVTVTAQKIEESIQDVPIAVTALSGDSMADLKIERGEELLRAVPNVNFSKNNFSTYNFSIRGVGTKAVSANSDPAVAVSFNNAPLIRNRLFEQEFFDVQRVEVLRGPQGTLYGRNATAGVVNMLPVMPQNEFSADIKAEVGNFNSRRTSGMINIPLGETFAIRASGVMTKRNGFDKNTFTGNDVNDRDLLSTRLILDWQPSDNFNANFIWQHFEEDDMRSRTGKQLCTRDNGPNMVGETAVPEEGNDIIGYRSSFSQGCKAESLYSDNAYGTPNAKSFGFVSALLGLGGRLGDDADNNSINKLTTGDIFADVKQSKNLREIATSYDPKFQAENDLFQFNFEWGLNDSLTFYSQTTYAKDDYYSTQDYNRYVSQPLFNDSEGLFYTDLGDGSIVKPIPHSGPTPGGVFTDPQLGPSDRMLAVDISKSDNEQFSQEIRLQSSFDGRFNFSIGANYLDFETQDDYYVFNNLFTYMAQYLYNDLEGSRDPGLTTVNCTDLEKNGARECVYVDPNSLENINDEGHNYFLSRNVVNIESKAIFGEAYWNFTDDVKLTTGLRYTIDTKTSTPIPTQLLLGAWHNEEGEIEDSGQSTGGKISRGFEPLPDVKQEWKAFTGRAVLDWKGETPFTDETLFYISLAHGYKGGGTNPPRMDIDPVKVQFQSLESKFKPEYVNAIEFGTKNSLLGSTMQLNTTAFYYDYKDYQVSQIVDRISLNENFDAETWGFEVEGLWQFTENTRFDVNLGYLKTRIGEGAKSIDVMNRTQGNEDWMVIRPWIQVPSNCIAPVEHVEKILQFGASLPPEFDSGSLAVRMLCGGSKQFGSFDGSGGIPWGQIYGIEYNPLTDAPNGGRGFYADLEGNELPNAPSFTANFGVEHIIPVHDWDLKLRADYYYQSESYGRVYNTEFDRLKAWSNVNISATATNLHSDLQVQLYVKNLFDDAPITDFFVNSDDTGLTANVFTLEPRIVGLSLYKGF
ncbi:TonB-dependent receptor domain-containing protein [Microbulbifer spongiae]|uniref:TonB-dependent receptor n=1 Tax=Microbulbifer spongiae TaxID=2944933 RepID=A0ABY9EI12_9GAMM|nr:TonB-dependent receptor [Microbulbifer sp. MI-G]WKD51245.1 TonB-dependent receptor [Microbulbifer sp. MI-G]